jgi:tricarballylate dehydrogenase
MLPASADVVIVGAGNAAFCAALAAAEHGVSVLVLERAPQGEDGGNSRFTAGAFRCVYDGFEDLKLLMPDLTPDEVRATDFGTYTQDQFFDDMGRVTEYRADPELLELLVTRSRDTMRWMRAKGVRFAPIWGRHAFKVVRRFKFWGGLTVEAHGGGPGLVTALTEAARRNGITVAPRRSASSPTMRASRGCACATRGAPPLATRSVVPAAGASRPTPNGARATWAPAGTSPRCAAPGLYGRLIRMALDVGAQPTGNWSGCHAVGWTATRRSRRPRRRRQLPEAQLPVRHRSTPTASASSTRAPTSATTIRQVRPRDPQSAGPIRLANLRRQGAAPSAGRVSHPPRHRPAPTAPRSWSASSTA